GRVTLSAAARGRTVVLKLTDDGRGIRQEELVERAKERGLLREDEPPPLDPLELIFRPGFSTKAAVSELSGRGVGLDVVRSNIAALKGTVSVRSSPGAGAEFMVVVPMTLALVESLLVRASGRTFALPSADVLRTFRFERGRTRTKGGRMSVEEGGESLPLFELGRLLGLADETFGRNAAVVVSEQGDRRAGFIVGSIEGIRDVMVKTLPDDLPRASEVTGTAELPGGELALALDTGLLLARVQNEEMPLA
ncbi:MAG TPA: chemotaxis protein CheW, partial [Thermoanaerobaculia bacterium]|nr:chemotaxis protein CheW [Thermoanaerobaculia bacterium]